MAHHETFITGIAHRSGAREIVAALSEGAVMTLQPEPTNSYDRNAVKVRCPAGNHVGYIPKEMSAEVAKLIASGRFTRCVKRAGSRIEVHFDEAEASAA